MKFHPYADIFPLIEGDDFDSLIADIKANGLRHVITTYKGKILDGRNRFLACQKAKVKPHFHKFQGDDDAALAFVVSANIQRRHLTPSQRAMVAARLASLGEGRPSKTAPRGAVSQSDAADQLDVSRRSVQRAKQVIDKGSKALQGAVESGDVPLKKAASVTDLPKSEQLAAATEAAPELADEWEPDENEDEQLAKSESEYARAIDAVMASDDKLAAAHSEIKRQAAEIAALKVSRDGYLNGKNAVAKLVKKEQQKVQKLSKALDKANAEIEKLRERLAIMKEVA